MKLIINERQLKTLIKAYQKKILTEQDFTSVFSQGLKSLSDKFFNLKLPSDKHWLFGSNKSSYDDQYDDNDYSSDNSIINTGSYFVHPDYEKVSIKYGENAKPLNKDAEILLKSIAAESGIKTLNITSTLRDYISQARANKNNTEQELKQWYCHRGDKDCDEFINNVKTMDINTLANYFEERDKKGKKMSVHLNDRAIDISPYDSNLSNVAEKIKSKGKSGIETVYPEQGVLHIEFNFPVTGISGVKTPTLTKAKPMGGENVIDNGSVIIVTKNKNSNEYSLVYGGIPKDKHGARFMYEKGENAKKLKNKNMIYSNHDVPINFIETDIKKINPNAKIKSVTGFSAGQKFTLPAMRTGNYEFIGLIDPYIPKFISSLPANTVMISNHNQWGSYPEAVTALKQMEDSKISKFENIPHLEMPKKFFEEYGELM